MPSCSGFRGFFWYLLVIWCKNYGRIVSLVLTKVVVEVSNWQVNIALRKDWLILNFAYRKYVIIKDYLKKRILKWACTSIFMHALHYLILHTLLLQVFLQVSQKYLAKYLPWPLQTMLFMYEEWQQHLPLQGELKLSAINFFCKTCYKYFGQNCRNTAYHHLCLG